MATENRIYIKTKGSANTDAGTSDINIGELALNANTGKLFVGTKIGDTDGTYPGGTPDEASWVGAPIKDTDNFSDASATSLATSESIKAYADLMLPLAGGTMSGAIAMGTAAITGMADPSGAQDASTKAYVDAAEARAAQGLVVKANVVAATTASFTMASTATATTLVLADGEGGFSASGDTLTIDGVSVATGGRVLIKNGVNSNSAGVLDKWNGVYTAADPSGGTTLTLTRGTDMDATGDQWANSFLFVAGGTINADTGWVSTVDEATVTVGTTAVTFAQFNSAGTVTAGTNMSKVGNTLNVDDAFLKNSAADVMSVSGAGLTLKDMNTTGSSTTGGFLKLQMDDGAATADDMRLGVIEFAAAEDNANNLQTGAKIQAMTDATWSGLENGTRLEFYTMDGNATSEISLTLDSDKLATFAGNVAPAGVTLGGHTFDDIDIGTEFTDADDHLMSAGAIKEKIESYNYGTSSGDLTAIVAGTNLGGSNLDGPIPTINLDSTIDLAGGAITMGALAQAGAITQNPTTVGTVGNALTVTGSLVTTGSGTADRAGGAVIIAGGTGTGTGTSGSILFKTTPAGATTGTATSDGTQATMLTISSTGLSTPGTMNVDGDSTLDGITAAGDALTLTTGQQYGGAFQFTPAAVTEHGSAATHTLIAGATFKPFAVANAGAATTTSIATMHIDGVPTAPSNSNAAINLYSLWCGGVNGTDVDGRIGGAIISGGTY